MSIYENFISDEELKSIAETQEIKYKMDCNELIAQGIAQGITQGLAKGIAQGMAQGEAKGETNAKIEAVCKLVKKYKVDIVTAMVDLNLKPKYKSQVLKKLKELES